MRNPLQVLRLQLAARLLGWGRSLHDFSAALALQRERLPILVFLHGYALAHTIRPLVVARALRDRGYPVSLAGRGPRVVMARQEGFPIHDVETLPQSRMDQFVARGEYAYYDHEWIDRCVRSERTLIKMLRPALVIHEMKPTAAISARLEGVDDARITQAYNQPGYRAPFYLPGYFASGAGPFDEYLADRAAEVKPQRSFQLLADIPELHPPGRAVSGYHYVGPLLDRPPEPAHLGMLDDGWDTSLPLIYVTCGSSGRTVDYLDPLLEALASRPCRVLVTTAGRWTPRAGRPYAASSRVRVTDFLPGEWILRRADLLVGVVGNGAIYQALSHGVPVIGSPEHLDQEIHLARLEALGLGIKIDRADFGADAILAAIDRIVLDREGYRERGRPLAEALRSCPDGALVADLVDSHFARAGRAYSTDSAYLTPIEDFVRYLECSTPPELGRAAIEEMVARGLARGMPHVQREGRTFADQVDSWNWLNEHEPRFFEADYWAQEVKRSRFFTATGSGVRARGLVQHYRATYSLRFLSAEGAAGPEGRRRLKVFLPYPVTRPGQQTGVRLLSCTPTDMARNLVPAAGFFYGYVCTATSEGGAPAFEYTCEYTSRELARERLPGPAELPASEARRYLELDPAILRLPEFIQFRRSLDLPARATALHTARAIYDALCRTKRFRKTKDPTHNPLYCVAAVLGQEGAHCVTLARTYISLCRAAGIPAREVTGALMGYPMPDGAFERRGYCEPLFGHTWAEVHVPGEGWLPVEFHSLAIGAAALRPGNVSDRRLRRTIRDNTHPYDSYYFGNLDHQRIVCSGSIKHIPQILVESPLPASGEGRPWKPDDGLKYECRLRIELA